MESKHFKGEYLCGDCKDVVFDPDPNGPDFKCAEWGVGLKGSWPREGPDGSEGAYKCTQCRKID
jgi:hypothetical protein